MKNYLYILVIAVAAGCASEQNKNEENTLPKLPVLQVNTIDTVLKHDYVTSIEAVKNVEIRARVQGFLSKIFVDEGQEVKKGTPLFQIDQHEFLNEVAKAKAGVSNAQAEAKTAEVELKRVKTLLAKAIVSPTELEMAEARLKAANAKTEEAISAQRNAETKLSYTNILSPFDGVIDRIPLKAGSLVDAGALLTTISDNHEVYAYFNISENEYLNYRRSNGEERDNSVQLILADGSVYSQQGKIETVDGEFDEGTGSIAFRARFGNPSKLLRHGATGKVRITSQAKDALIVPQKSVFEIQDKNYVFVVGADSVVTMKTVIPQTRLSQYYIIKDGLNSGDKILYEGIQSIKEGMRIQPLNVSRQM
ncbi:MAG: efflux RND transporter periplasmic adaptor subunit [Chitinophagaceae bacterium]|nr:efflux RND transporter periplasmic adaptor subunit [Chitinophagaceae bacterium]